MSLQTIKLVRIMYYKKEENRAKINEFAQILKSAHTLAAILDHILNNKKIQIN